MNPPRTFFQDYVVRSLGEWDAEPTEEYRAKRVVQELNSLVDRYFEHWQPIDATKVGNARDVAAFRKHLAFTCAEFQVIWNVADAHKHGRLTRGTPVVSRHDQTKAAATPWGSGWNSFWSGTIVVDLNDGTKLALRPIVAKVMTMWEGLL